MPALSIALAKATRSHNNLIRIMNKQEKINKNKQINKVIRKHPPNRY